MVEFSYWFFGVAISFLILTFMPWPIWKAIKFIAAQNWSDEKIEARMSYLSAHRNPFNQVEWEALEDIKTNRMNQRMKEYTKEEWSKYE